MKILATVHHNKLEVVSVQAPLANAHYPVWPQGGAAVAYICTQPIMSGKETLIFLFVKELNSLYQDMKVYSQKMFPGINVLMSHVNS